MRRCAVLVVALAWPACAGPQVPADARTTVVSLSHLDCGDCGDRLAKDVRATPGVYATKFDRRKAELTIVAAPGVDALAAARSLKEEDYELEPGPGHGFYVAWTKPPAGVDVKTISADGADVPDLAPHAVAGKVTVFDFSATWCEPCRTLDAHVLEMLTSRTDVAYRKLDVGDWDTPLAKRYLKGVAKLPYVIVVDTTGRRVGAVTGLDLDKLDRLIGPHPP